MKNILLIITLTLICNFHFENHLFNRKPLQTDACELWNHDYSELVPYQIKDLQTKGIASSRHGYILSESLVSDCKLRFEIGEYIGKVIGGRTDENDNKFAAQNSKEIVRVIRLTWESYSDGASEEKYHLLETKEIKDEDISPFINELIQKEGLQNKEIDASLFFTLLKHSFSPFKATIENLLAKAESSDDYLEQFLALILLYRDARQPEFLSKMKTISQNPKLSTSAQKLARQIIHKLKRKEELERELVDSFEIEMF